MWYDHDHCTSCHDTFNNETVSMYIVFAWQKISINWNVFGFFPFCLCDVNALIQMLCALRLTEGLCQGVIFPSTHTLLSKWAPVSERAQLATYCYSGSQFGTVVMLSSSGILASSFMGWPSIFYLSGCASALWAILWLFFGSNSPADCKSISAEERDFIQASLGHNDTDPEHDEVKRRKTPWSDIFLSMPFYSLVIVHAAHNWGFWTLLTEMPSYMKGVLKFDIKKVNTILRIYIPFDIGHHYKINGIDYYRDSIGRTLYRYFMFSLIFFLWKQIIFIVHYFNAIHRMPCYQRCLI